MIQRNILPCLLCSLLLFGCNKEHVGNSQVIAKVNGEELSVHQLNAMLPATQGMSADAAAKMRKEALDRLVKQQLAYAQATDKKLDRSPKVMLEIEMAKREIVARAYIDQIVATLPKPNDDEIGKYYASNPALFANRRIYNMQEISLGSDQGTIEEIKRMVAAGRTLEEVGTWLKGKGIPFRAGGSARPAEDIPLDILPRIAELKDGQSIVISAAQGSSVIRVVSSQPAPIDEAAAKESIRAYLHNSNATRVVAAEFERLQAAAKIEFKGEFSGAESAPQAKPAAAPIAGPADKAGSMEKGVSGLK